MALIDNIISYWKLDESSGNAADSSGNGNTLTNVNTATYVAAKINNGVSLARSSSQYLKIADASQTGLDLAGSITISCWAKWSSYSNTSYYGLVTKRRSGAYAYSMWYAEPEGGFRIGFSSDGTTGENLGDASWATFVPSAGTWYHIVIVYDNTAGTAILYINGSKYGSTLTGLTTSAINNSDEEFAIGALNGTTNIDAPTVHWFDGIIDEVGIWSRALSGAEVTSLYNGGAGLAYPFASSNNGAGFFMMMR